MADVYSSVKKSARYKKKAWVQNSNSDRATDYFRFPWIQWICKFCGGDISFVILICLKET